MRCETIDDAAALLELERAGVFRESCEGECGRRGESNYTNRCGGPVYWCDECLELEYQRVW